MDNSLKQIRWGVLGVARIATVKVIPAMQQCRFGHVAAIASRDLGKAQKAAAELGIAKAYGSYEELLRDPEIDAIYNPLPNNLHVPWSVKAAAAQKHVLCEKPVAMTALECRELIAARDKYGVKIGEAFMVRSHPQWLRTLELVRGGTLGQLRAVIAAFTYNNQNPRNIRNIPEYGGGALMDIGCYAIQISRWMFGEEPTGVCSAIDRDPAWKTDRLTSALLTFPSGHAIFTSATQVMPYQRVQLLCTGGRVEVEIPFNAMPENHARIVITTPERQHAEEFPLCDQYTLQGDDFARAILDGTEVPTPLEDALRNMEVIDRVFANANTR
jgi:predicted dehydrogenase